MRPVSSGSRSASSAARGNSGSSSRNSTPWCASEISPGRGGEPPPTSAADDALWCGARSTRWPQRCDREGAGQAEHGCRFERLVVGRAPAAAPTKRCASIDLPVPGGPTIKTLWPPAAAISSARLAPAWPLTSAQSARRAGVRIAAGARRRRTARHRAASRRQQCAHDIEQVRGAVDRPAVDQRRLVGAGLRAAPARARRRRAARSARLIASAPRTGRSSPASDSSPANSKRRAARRRSARGGQDAERDRQVEAARFLRQVGRREVDRDALVVRELEAAGQQRGAHPLARLLDLGVGEADQGEARQAVGEMHLDGDRGRVEAVERAAVDDGKDIDRSSHRARSSGTYRMGGRERERAALQGCAARRLDVPPLGHSRACGPDRPHLPVAAQWHGTCETVCRDIVHPSIQESP